MFHASFFPAAKLENMPVTEIKPWHHGSGSSDKDMSVVRVFGSSGGRN
jgi:hypothetical protein